jgi:hypothetical protein
MAETTVNTPSGEIVVVHPDGASEESILRFAKSQHDANFNVIDPSAEATPASGGVRGIFEGVGKGISDVGIGLRQLNAIVNPGVLSTDQAMVAAGVSPEDVRAKRRLDAPLMETPSGVTGSVAGNIMAAAPTMLIPGANTLTGAALIGGGLGLAQPAESSDERVLNTVLGAGGGAVGQKVGSVFANRLARQPGVATGTTGAGGASVNIQGAPTVRVSGGGSGFGTVGADPSAGLTAGQRLAAETGTDLGMRLTPGQATGSRALQQMEAKLSSQPITSGPFNAVRDNNQRVLNRSWAEAIGVEGDDLSAPVLARAYDDMAAVFESMPQRIGVQDISPKSALELISGLQDGYKGVTARPVLNNPLTKEFINLAKSGEATGAQLRSLTSRLGKRINTEYTSAAGDRSMGEALSNVKTFIDDIIEGGLSNADQAAYRQARDRYRHYLLLTQRVNVINPSSGNVNGVSLANLLQTKDKSGYLRGNNQTAAYNTARFAQAFKDIVGDSGTATRSMVNNPIEAIASMPFNVAGRAYTSPSVVSLISGADEGILSLAELLGPSVDPRFLSILGSSSAIQSGR